MIQVKEAMESFAINLSREPSLWFSQSTFFMLGEKNYLNFKAKPDKVLPGNSCKSHWEEKVLPYIGLTKSSFEIFHNILQKNPNELFGQPNTIRTEDHYSKLCNEKSQCKEWQ